MTTLRTTAKLLSVAHDLHGRLIPRTDSGLREKPSAQDDKGERLYGAALAPADPQVDRGGVTGAGEDLEEGLDDGDAVERRRDHDRHADVGIRLDGPFHEQLRAEIAQGAGEANARQSGEQEEDREHGHVLVETVKSGERKPAGA